MKTIFRTLAFALVIIIGAFFVFAYARRADIAEVQDSDLRKDQPVVAEADNAYPLVVKIQPDITISQDDFNWIESVLAGKDWDEKRVNDIIMSQAVALNAFDSISQKRAYQYSQADLENGGGLLGPSRRIADLALLRGLQLEKEGKFNEAFQLSEKALAFSQAVVGSSNSLIQYMVGAVMKKTALSRLQVLINTNQLSYEFLNQEAATISNYRDDLPGLQVGLRGEYSLSASWAESDPNFARDAGIFPKMFYTRSYYWKPKMTLQQKAEQMRIIIKNVGTACGNNHREFIVQPGLFPVSKLSYPFTENLIGRKHVDLMVDSINQTSLYDRRCENEAAFDNLQAIMIRRAGS